MLKHIKLKQRDRDTDKYTFAILYVLIKGNKHKTL